MRNIAIFCAGILMINACSSNRQNIGQTAITKWQYGKNGAVTITFDDGSINQFKIALPMMTRLKIPGTFFIITGQIPGSLHQRKFIGRPVKEIIEETPTVPTNQDNFLERASAASCLGFRGTRTYHTNAGIKIDAGKPEEAFKIIDELYRKVRNGEFQVENTGGERNQENMVTWDTIRLYAGQSHEFASHTVSHPYLSALDEVNMRYELEMSREDIRVQLGDRFTFSSTIPYASDEDRIMQEAYRHYPAVRTRNPEDFAGIVDELNSSNARSPGSSDMEYVKWLCRVFAGLP